MVLSACWVGQGDADLAGEYYGLVQALLQRPGTAAVVAPLWPVGDLSGFLFCTEMHRLLREGVALGEALRRSRRYLRSITAAEVASDPRLAPLFREVLARPETPEDDLRRFVVMLQHPGKEMPGYRLFQHPYHWAPFTLFGLPNVALAKRTS